MIQPEVAFISTGNGNSHGHPHNDTLKRLVDHGGTHIYQTEIGAAVGAVPPRVKAARFAFDSDIVLTTDGQTYQITTPMVFAVDN